MCESFAGVSESTGVLSSFEVVGFKKIAGRQVVTRLSEVLVLTLQR